MDNNSTIKTGSVITYKNRNYTVKGIRYIVVYGKYFTNKNIVAEMWVVGKRGATYHGFLYANGNIFIADTFGSQVIRYIGDYGYDAEAGTTVAHSPLMEHYKTKEMINLAKESGYGI